MARGEDCVDWSIKFPNCAIPLKDKTYLVMEHDKFDRSLSVMQKIVRLFFLIFNRLGVRITQETS